jgi:hypothetical protein
MSLFLANCGLLARAPGGGGGGVDPDAEPYIDALGVLGIVDSTLNSAWNNFVLDAKADSYWSAFTGALYPFGGGTANSHAINAVNPGSRDITWHGTVTHNANGVTGDGLTGYGDTGINALSVLNNADCHAALYTRTSSVGNEQVAGLSIRDASGSGRAFEFNPRRTSSASFRTGDVTASGGNINCQGFCIGTRRSTSDAEVYRNGSSVGTNTTTQTSTHLGDGNIYLFAMNFVGIGILEFSSRNHAFASIGSGIADAEAADYYAAVQAFQTALGRQV